MRTVKEVGRNYTSDIDIPSASIDYTTTTITANATLSDISGLVTVLCDCTSGNITISLPTAVGNQAAFNIKKIDSSSNTVTIDPDSSETIDGAATVTIYDDDDFVQVQSDNSNWVITNCKLNLKW